MKKQADISSIEGTVFYALDKAIRTYRQFAQRNINLNHLDITIDQWLILKTIRDHPKMNQKEIAEHVFKDYASITRIIEILVRNEYLKRSFHQTDRRRYQLSLTSEGEKVYVKLLPIIQKNRETALVGLGTRDVDLLQGLLLKITDNCTRQ